MLRYRVIAVVVVLALTHGYNAVRGHRTGSNNAGAEDYLRRKTTKNRKLYKYTITETNHVPQDKNKKGVYSLPGMMMAMMMMIIISHY